MVSNTFCPIHGESQGFGCVKCAKGDKPEDSVNHPKHYNSHPSGVECITITEHMNFNVGNAIKYLWRTEHKNGLEDLKKAQWYIEREIKRRPAEPKIKFTTDISPYGDNTVFVKARRRPDGSLLTVDWFERKPGDQSTEKEALAWMRKSSELYGRPSWLRERDDE